MADASGDRPWYEEPAPDLEGDAGRGVEGSRVDSRRRVMAVWRGFEDSRAGVWLAEHTRLLAALSREGSVLVRRLAAQQAEGVGSQLMGRALFIIERQYKPGTGKMVADLIDLRQRLFMEGHADDPGGNLITHLYTPLLCMAFPA